MPKTKFQKNWEKAHPEKVKEYYGKYLADKVRFLVTINAEDAVAIDSVKNPSESRAQWVRRVALEALYSATKESSEIGNSSDVHKGHTS